MKTQSVSNKIKVLGALLMLTVFTVITVTIYLNHKNTKDALIVNIAGKQRMLTQRITKNIYFINHTKSNNFKEMEDAMSQFVYGLSTLKDGNDSLKISKPPVENIRVQIEKVQILWNNFYKNSIEFKGAILKNDTQKINSLLMYFHEANNELLFEVDEIVTLYTKHIEQKTKFIKNFQYLAFSFLFVLAIYALIQLKQIELHAREFIQKAKLLSSKDIENVELMEVDGESEFVEIADNFNRFISKVSSAVDYSENALNQSKLASEKLESLTDEFETLIGELGNKSELTSQLDRSEDIVIESTEELLKSTKKLKDLKAELDKLLQGVK